MADRPLRQVLPLLLLLAGIGSCRPAHADTFYVRTDGGDALECSGRSDAPYPGSGTDQACAWKHPFYALVPGGVARIGGGDTLFIDSGSYMIGLGAPGTDACLAVDCFMPPIPSGAVGAMTRIIGVSTPPPRLWGTAGVNRILNLDGSSNVEVGNLEITDQDDCVYSHSNGAARCPATGRGNWARFGLSAAASSNVWLHDLNIHGMAAAAMHAGGLTDWTMERMRIFANGRSGWDANIGNGSSNSGNIVLRAVDVGWSGCGERWQTGEPWACWAQQTGGYGDGLGTTYTAGHWLIEDSFFHHNTSDGLDLRFMDGADGTDVIVRRTYAVANAGNQIKVRGNATIENNVIVGSCGYFGTNYYMLHADNCRASGNALQLVFTSNDIATVRHNTITGEGGVLIGATEGDSTSSIRIQNNVLVGFPVFLDPSKLSVVFYANAAPAAVSWAGNLVWNVKSSTCPADSICGQDPKLANMALYGFDAEPLPGSPVSDKVPSLIDVTSDFVLQPRPYGASSDIGAYELQFDNPCVRAEPGLTITGPTTETPAGTTVAYTVALSNNDNTVCIGTTFSLASSVPDGWTGALASNAFTLVPGASASTTLSVTSANEAPPADYTIGIGASSSEGAVHTTSASAGYTVAEPTPVCTRATPSLSVSGPSAAVPAGSGVDYTVTLDNHDSSACATTSFSLAQSVPAGWSGSLAATSLSLAPGASDSTTLHVTSANDASPGDYTIGVGAGSGEGAVHTTSASAGYTVAEPTPVCTRATPSLSVSGPSAAVPAGSGVDYTVTLDNHDSSACTTTSFNLAQSVPAGWTGSLAASSVSLAPGARDSTTLHVTSANDASPGDYTIGVGAGSGEGAVHTTSASAGYTVAEPTPVCTRATPSLSVSGPSAAVPAGSGVDYTVTLDNHDSSACATTSFSLAQSVPAGWSGSLAASSVSLAPGARDSTTLHVTSANDASPGDYTIGVGAGSGEGAVHTVNASATYTVAAPAPALQTQVGTNKVTYSRGETVQIQALLRNNNAPVSGATVTFAVTRPNGTTTTATTTSGSDGYARTTFKVSKAKNAPGQYTVRATWGVGNVTATATVTFAVL